MTVIPGRAAQDRIERLGNLLSHDDPSQLWFQLAEIAGEQTYLRHGIEVGPGDVVLDVGANVGVAAAFFALECGARTVHCFEPVGPVFELLRANLRDVPSCVLHERGLHRAPGRASITYYPRAAAMSGLYADPARDRALVATTLGNLGLPREDVELRLEGVHEARTLTCELITLSAFLREQELDEVGLLKVDVERAELDVLAGIGEHDWPRIRQTVIEAHDEDGRCDRIAAELRERGFRVTADQDPVMRGTEVRVLYATRA